MRDRLVELRIRQMVLRYLAGHLRHKPGRRAKGGGDGAAASMLKLAMAQLVQESARVAVERGRHGRHGVGSGRSARGGAGRIQLLNSLSASLGGGTNEIVRNVIAERVLGLPRDEEGDLMPGDLATPGRRAGGH